MTKEPTKDPTVKEGAWLVRRNGKGVRINFKEASAKVKFTVRLSPEIMSYDCPYPQWKKVVKVVLRSQAWNCQTF